MMNRLHRHITKQIRTVFVRQSLLLEVRCKFPSGGINSIYWSPCRNVSGFSDIEGKYKFSEDKSIRELGFGRNPENIFSRSDVEKDERIDNTIVFEHLDELFRDKDDKLGEEEWMDVREELTGFPFAGKTVNRTNVDSCILQYIRSRSSLGLGRNFTNFLTGRKELQTPQILHLLKLYIDSTDFNEAEDDILALCLPILDQDYDSIPPNMFWDVITLLARTSKWKLALEAGLAAADQSQHAKSLTMPAFTELILRALREGEEEIMWSLMENALFHQHHLPIRQSLGTSKQKCLDNVFVVWIEHCNKVRETIGDQEAEIAMAKIYLYFQRLGVLPSSSVQDAIKKYYDHYTGSERLSAVFTKVSASGFCRSCGSSLTIIEKEDEGKFQHLKKSVISEVIARKDIYNTTNPKELNEYLELLERKGPFDVVIDGLNVEFSATPQNYKNSKAFFNLRSLQVKDVVDHFYDQGLKVLVISRQQIKGLKDYKHICARATVHALGKVSEDDPYMIVGALHSGPQCMIVTNDALRQHFFLLYQLEPGLGKMFTEWQVSHQVRVPAYRAYTTHLAPLQVTYTDPVVILPPKHPLYACNTPPYWHLPLEVDRTKENINNTTMVLPSSWLCVGPTNGRKAIKETVLPREEESHYEYQVAGKVAKVPWSRDTTLVERQGFENNGEPSRESQNRFSMKNRLQLRKPGEPSRLDRRREESYEGGNLKSKNQYRKLDTNNRTRVNLKDVLEDLKLKK